jgi:hypothetical protein
MHSLANCFFSRFCLHESVLDEESCSVSTVDAALAERLKGGLESVVDVLERDLAVTSIVARLHHLLRLL